MSSPSSRRESTAAAEFDHQIVLVDNSRRTAERLVLSESASDPVPNSTPPASPTSPISPSSSSPRNSEAFLSRKWSLREEIARRKYSKWQEGRFAGDAENGPVEESRRNSGYIQADGTEDVDDFGVADEPRRVSMKPAAVKEARGDKSGRYEVDILYENQRGSFICGIPLFSHKSLLNFDPSPWVNAALKDSPVDIMNAQVPDPSWRWAWKSWYVDMSADVDEEGWQYSFSFSPTFPWHGTHVWFHSFVRRRRWLRKRARAYCARDYGMDGADSKLKEGHMLNPDYFSIHSKRYRTRGPENENTSNSESRWSYIGPTETDEADLSDIQDISSLMATLRKARIDREKVEAVETFLEQGGEEIIYLSNRMPEIMASLVFQASRRQLLAHLSRKFDTVSSHRDQHLERGEPEDDVEQRKIDNLLKAIHAADEQVKELEFWSDVRAMAREGENSGAADDGQGWGCRWGPDAGGPTSLPASRTGSNYTDPGKRAERKRVFQGQETLDKGKGKA
ncbi:hypothetical protein FGG08_003269 [Glutinoglossum americanum]|uniref:Peroxin/Ferlin domain-containing protein n=1 Tax=Glutinoglossum americanum TaxID=1670608 RepID=A0A9P8I2X9_9PEZI|nr:hypothetical protein FGG08_003269 [Glutinoglossum americanum]